MIEGGRSEVIWGGLRNATLRVRLMFALDWAEGQTTHGIYVGGELSRSERSHLSFSKTDDKRGLHFLYLDEAIP